MIPVLIGLASAAVTAAPVVVGTAVGLAVVDEIRERQQKSATTVEKKVVSKEYVRARVRNGELKLRRAGD